MRFSFYGLIVAAAILAGFIVAAKKAKRFAITRQHLEDLLPWLVIAGFAGGRVYFVIFTWSYFGRHLSEIPKIWHGGLAIYGAVAFAAAAALLFAKIAKISFWKLADLLALVAPLGQAIGRWGNFFNQEAFGRPTTLPWGIYISPALRPSEFLSEKYFHPTFLYESLWDLAVFFFLLYLSRKPALKDGIILGSYLSLYAAGRFFIESLRVDSFFAWGLRVDQITSAAAFLAGLSILITSHARAQTENILPHS